MLTAAIRGEAAPTAANSDTEITTIYSHQSTVPIRLSASLRRLLIEQFEGPTLRILADLMDDENPKLVARRRLTDEGIEELVDIIVNRRSVPTAGFFRRWSR